MGGESGGGGAGSAAAGDGSGGVVVGTGKVRTYAIHDQDMSDTPTLEDVSITRTIVKPPDLYKLRTALLELHSPPFYPPILTSTLPSSRPLVSGTIHRRQSFRSSESDLEGAL